MNEQNDKARAEFWALVAKHGRDKVKWKTNAYVPSPGASFRYASDLIPLFDAESYVFEIAPQKLYTKSLEIPRPMTEAPSSGSLYYISSLAAKHGYSECLWAGEELDLRWLRAGICYADKEDAAEATRAMLAREEK